MRLSIRTLTLPAVAACLALLAAAPGAAAAPQDRDRGPDIGIGIGIGIDLDLGNLLGGSYRSARLTGAAEVPGPGDPDGRGTARVVVGYDEVCVSLAVTRIGTPTAAHVHRGAAGTAGPVALELRTPGNGRSRTCTDVDPDLARELRRSPSQFYVNVHNAEYPAGAVRGQLRR
ncbi:CHRD domain-containing protein [Crossiella sp. CA-258035]|uniref:CHRD domain-containing protein n=1 Tax=Crossiella sp. CA-258035 TaxID=2981138 RepID=UPI0024BC6BFE|nr:CHRD domain-containing protein [Crossiella sp. CA-258035]WHT16201.1 CHRD domain-containing protein [Crossiella sp. CA-258035]